MTKKSTVKIQSNKSASKSASKASSPKFKPIRSGAVHGKMPRTLGLGFP